MKERFQKIRIQSSTADSSLLTWRHSFFSQTCTRLLHAPPPSLCCCLLEVPQERQAGKSSSLYNTTYERETSLSFGLAEISAFIQMVLAIVSAIWQLWERTEWTRGGRNSNHLGRLLKSSYMFIKIKKTHTHNYIYKHTHTHIVTYPSWVA